jgi:hypothetical protein
MVVHPSAYTEYIVGTTLKCDEKIKIVLECVIYNSSSSYPVGYFDLFSLLFFCIFRTKGFVFKLIDIVQEKSQNLILLWSKPLGGACTKMYCRYYSVSSHMTQGTTHISRLYKLLLVVHMFEKKMEKKMEDAYVKSLW